MSIEAPLPHNRHYEQRGTIFILNNAYIVLSTFFFLFCFAQSISLPPLQNINSLVALFTASSSPPSSLPPPSAPAAAAAPASILVAPSPPAFVPPPSSAHLGKCLSFVFFILCSSFLLITILYRHNQRLLLVPFPSLHQLLSHRSSSGHPMSQR